MIGTRSKSVFSLIVIFAVLALLCLPSITIAFASGTNEPTTLILKIGSLDLATTKGASATTTKLDAAPVIKESRTFLPIRAVVEALEGKINWDQATQKVTITQGSRTLELWIGNPAAKIDGADSFIDPGNSAVVPYVSKEGRTMVPLRFVSENLGATISFDQTTQKITIGYVPGSVSAIPTPNQSDILYTFSTGVDGWIGDGGQKTFDKAQWGDLGEGSLRIDGSDLGTPDTSPNSWFYKKITLQSRNTLSFSFDARSGGPDNDANLRVRLVDFNNKSYTLIDWTLIKGEEWVHKSIDISKFKGQGVTIYFEQNDSGEGIGEIIFVDNVSIK